MFHIRDEAKSLVQSLLLSGAITVPVFLLYHMGPQEGALERIATLLGGRITNGGYIQFMTYVAFFWSYIEIREKRQRLKRERKMFRKKLLPTNEKHLLLSNEIRDLQFRMSDMEKNTPSLLISMIKKACTKFRSTQSIPEVLEIISIQTEINKEKAESEQSIIRYLTWVIPSIGFIGTVLGISKALMVANSGDMEVITATLGVAFDTTLIALVLSIVIMWFFHGLQEETDQLHASIKEYVVENLVNRIEVE